MTNNERVRELSQFLDALPFQQYVSLTYPRRLPRPVAEFTLKRWLTLLERYHRAIIGAVASLESRPDGRHIHHHLLLLCHKAFDARFEQETWALLSNARSKHGIEIDRYDPARGALSYVVKSYTTPYDEIQLLNLEYFASLPSAYWTSTARGRRQHRRQLEIVESRLT